MPDIGNPYQSPQNVGILGKPFAAQGALTDTMLRHLKEASPWLRFIGILSYIGCGFMFFVGIIITIILSAVSSLADEFGGFPAGILGFAYIALGALTFFPARFIYSFGSKIRSYMLSRSDEDLEQAFKNNKSLWKFCGICSIVCLAFIPLGIIGSVIAVISSVFL
ncbi:MAG: hypothetical protein LBS57_05460 [Treponema sp.]|jgi:hypothetical protein|nr:hypothetical protein [Treponema sp.]